MTRLPDLERFYDILARLEARLGGSRTLAECDGRMGWPERGVYFFFEDGEMRSDSGRGLRGIRVGTHALIESPARLSGTASPSTAASRPPAPATTGAPSSG